MSRESRKDWIEHALRTQLPLRLSFEQLDAMADDFDTHVLASPEIDRFCSSSYWILPAHDTVMPKGDPWILRTPAGYIALMSGVTQQGVRVLQPLESAWALASPVVGRDPVALAEALFEMVHRRADEWDVLVLSGIREMSQSFNALVRVFARNYVLRRGPNSTRHVAMIDDGPDAFMKRRSRNFRRALTKARRRARDAGFTFEAGSLVYPPEVLFARIMDVESRSWKFEEGGGLASMAMEAFYAQMVRRLSHRGALRLLFAKSPDGEDCGYILGGVMGDTYRGLQFSFDDAHRDFALGNLMQIECIERLHEDGVRRYDLGSDMEYKTRWGEIDEDTMALFVCKT